jgi:hypothetical protein
MTTTATTTEPTDLPSLFSSSRVNTTRQTTGCRPDNQPVLSIRASVPPNRAAQFVAEALHDVRAYMQEHHATAAGPPFSICRRSGGADIDVEAGWPVVTAVASTNRIHSGALPDALLRRHATPDPS